MKRGESECIRVLAAALPDPDDLARRVGPCKSWRRRTHLSACWEGGQRCLGRATNRGQREAPEPVQERVERCVATPRESDSTGPRLERGPGNGTARRSHRRPI